MPLQRLIRVSDIIFAVAMTILALVSDPIPSDLSPEAVTQLLLQELPGLGIYATSFVTIAFYWFTHVNQFKHYQKTDAVHTFLSLFALLFVVLLPYATDLQESYDNVLSIDVFYSLTAIGIGTFSTAAWIYGAHKRRLVAPTLSDETIRHIRQESYSEPIIYLLAIGLGWLAPGSWEITVDLGFVIVFLIQARINQQRKNKLQKDNLPDLD